MPEEAEEVPVFVVTIDSQRYAGTAEDLRRHGFRPRPFRGVDGRQAATRARPDVTPFARHLSPDKVLGTTLSHLQLARDLSVAWPTGASAVLVLEDDALVAGATPRLLAELARGSAGWDAMRLYCQGRCAPEARIFAGSTAAYLLSERGARRMATFRAVYFSDMQLSSTELVTRNGPRLFTTTDPRGSFLVGDQGLSFWFQQSFLRVPGLGATVTLGGAVMLLFALGVAGWALRNALPLTVLFCAGVLLAALAALYGRAHGIGVVGREQRGWVVATTLGASAAAAGLLFFLGNGGGPWACAVPVLFFSETMAVLGCMGLATVH